MIKTKSFVNENYDFIKVNQLCVYFPNLNHLYAIKYIFAAFNLSKWKLSL